MLVIAKTADETVHTVIKRSRLFCRTRYDEGSPSFINENAVHFVYDGIVVFSLDKIGKTKFHIIPQVVKPEFIVGSVGDIFSVGLVSFNFIHIMLNRSYFKTEKIKDWAHPLCVSFGKIIVHCDDMNAISFQRVQIGRKRSNQSLSFPCLHLSYFPLVKNNAAHKLNIKGTHIDGPFTDFADDCKSFDEKVIKSRSLP